MNWFQKGKSCSLEGREVSGFDKSGTRHTGECTACWKDGFGTLFARVKAATGSKDLYASSCKTLPEQKKSDTKWKRAEYNFSGRRYEGQILDANTSNAYIEHKDPQTGQKTTVKVPRSHILDT